MTDIYDIRRANLRGLLKAKAQGKQATLALRLDVPPNLVSRWLSGKHIGDDVARGVEEVFGLPYGAMDRLSIATDQPPAVQSVDTIGYRLKEQRLACKFTLAELAAASDLSIGAISDIENGRQKSSTKLHRLAHALGVTPEWLETGADTRPAINPQPDSTLTDSSETALSRLINNWFASDADGRAFIEQAAKFAATLNRTEGSL